MSINRFTSTQEAYRALRKLILSRKLAPGEKLLVRELSGELNLSSTPIKEALAALEREALVTSIPYRGYFVPKIQMADVKEIYPLREVLEGLAARLSAAAVTPSLIARLGELVEEQEERIEHNDLEGYGDFDLSFHQALWEASANRRLQNMAETIDGQVRLLISSSAKIPGRPHLSLAEHRQILDNLQSADGEGAEASMRLHVRHAGAALMSYLADEDRGLADSSVTSSSHAGTQESDKEGAL